VLAMNQGASTLLLDEPTSALDDDWAEMACELLDQWLSDHPQGRIYAVTHDQRMKDRFNHVKTLAL
ncbi:MAG: ABC transporter ATP-binding protein, partial [Schleiferiaceae bacterium]